jgi:hypothetical protein
MEEKYWIYQDNWIFKPDFNEPLDKYIGIIKQSIGIKIEFETNLKFYFATYNTKNKILSLNILFVGYNCVILIFSNYDSKEICAQTNNRYNVEYHKNYKKSKFSHPLSNSLDNQIKLTHLTFGYYFSHPLANSLDNLTNLTHLTFGW